MFARYRSLPCIALSTLFAQLVAGCAVEPSKDCDTAARGATTKIFVVDRATKTPICDATVKIVQGSPVSDLRPAPGEQGAACYYTGAAFSEADQGKTITMHVARAGYQDALVMAKVEGDCHPDTFSPTIELNK